MTADSKPDSSWTDAFREREHLLPSASERAARQALMRPILQRAVREGGRRRRLRRLWNVGAVLVAAASAAAGAGLWQRRFASVETSMSPQVQVTEVAGTVLVNDGTGTKRLQHTTSVDHTTELTTLSDGQANLQSKCAKLSLRSSTQVILPADGFSKLGQELDLLHGSVSLRVTPLPAGEQLVINTPDAKVTVHGTSFDVTVDPQQRPQTCVRVREGVVDVRFSGSSTFITAGGNWGCEAKLEEPSATPPEPSSRGSSPQAASVRASTNKAASDSAAAGTLLREVELLKSALAAERRGDNRAATTSLRELLGKYPRSQLAPEAREALHRVSSRADGGI